MHTHILQHVPFEDVGSIAGWLKSRKAESTYTRFFEDESLPPTDDPDLVVILGGPMSANDESTLPWLSAEKDYIREAFKRHIPMLGICLGAQLIASALGARVCRNAHKEIGWHPVVSIPSHENAFQFPEAFYAFHWHGETFDLPEGATHLARTNGCPNQAFQMGDSIIGLQFHLETTPSSAQALIRNCRDEMEKGDYVQTEQQIMGFPASGYHKTNRIMDELLSYLVRNA
jgi:GMP synthase-like glutamine amidotransferase